MNTIYCNYCNKTWKYKKDYDKHFTCCEFFYRIRRTPMDDYGNRLPTQTELFRLVQELTLKCARLEQDVSRIKNSVCIRQKKIIMDCLNHPDQTPQITFYEWRKSIHLNINCILSAYDKSEMMNHWSVIRNPFLFRIFCRDLVDGIKYLLQHVIANNRMENPTLLPIRCFTQKANVFYIYVGNEDHLKTPKKNSEWKIMTAEEFETMIVGISQLFVREFIQWKQENADCIDEEDSRKDAYGTYMTRVNGLSSVKERGMTEIRKWLFSELEENAKTEFEFV